MASPICGILKLELGDMLVKMHILYLHQHFALPSGSTGTRSYEMARRWVAAGHRVTLICGRGDICGLPQQRRFQVDGIRVQAVGAAYSQKQGFLRRIAAFLYFMAACTLEGLRVQRVDVIFATSTPLTIGIPAMLLKWFKKIPYVFEVRDQWPEVPIELGYIRNPLLKKILLGLEKHIYQSSQAVVALSPGMAQGVRQTLGEIRKQVLIAPNSSDMDHFRPETDGSTIRCRMNWQGRFVVMHFGTMGYANGLDFLIRAAAKLVEQEDILFVLIGSGREKHRLQKVVSDRNLRNIVFLENICKKRLPMWVAACDVSTVIFADHPILEHNSANKFFDSLAAGKPVLLNYSGWQRELLESHQAGMGCRQCDVDAYTGNLLTLYANRELLSIMGKNARRLAESEFNREKTAAQVLSVLKEATNAGIK